MEYNDLGSCLRTQGETKFHRFAIKKDGARSKVVAFRLIVYAVAPSSQAHDQEVMGSQDIETGDGCCIQHKDEHPWQRYS
jgi:hypothetical protein